jgi:hypothetical protein
MVNRVDITQALTPSTPDVTGAVNAIRSQAGIAQTLFGGISSMLGEKKAEDLRKLQEEAEQITAGSIKATQLSKQATGDYLVAKRKQESDLQDLSSFGITEKTFTEQGKTLPFEADIFNAAQKYKNAQEQGAINQVQFLDRVRGLVNTYAGKYPGSKEEIRAIVAKGTGLPGADLWAQNQFVEQMFTPPKAADTDKALREAKKAKYEAIAEYNGVFLDDVINAETSNPKLYTQLEATANTIMQAKAAKAARDASAGDITSAGNIGFREFTDKAVDGASLGSVAKTREFFTANKGEMSNRIDNLLRITDPTPENIAEIETTLIQLSNIVESEFNDARANVLQNYNSSIAPEVRDDALKRIDQTKQSIVDKIKTGSLSERRAILQLFNVANTTTRNDNLKMIAVAGDQLKYFASNPTINNAFAHDEYKDGVKSPEWQTLESYSTSLAEQLRNYKKLVLSMPVGMSVPKPFFVTAAEDAQQNPNATPTGPTPQETKAGNDLVALNAATISKASAIVKAQGTMGGLGVVSTELATEMNKDANVVGTALSNVGYGRSLTLVAQNEENYKKFIKNLNEESLTPLKQAGSLIYEKSLSSAQKGVSDISKKYGLKTPLQIGVIPGTNKVGIIPPPKDYFEDVKTTYPYGRGFGAPAEKIQTVPAPFTQYFIGKTVKPEYVIEVNKLASAAKEWNNTYLPRVMGSTMSRSIYTGESKEKVANEIANLVSGNKPITGFFTIPVPQAAQAGTAATGGGVEVGIQGVGGGADRPERLDIETLRKMANSDALPSETRAKLAAIVADMEKNK